MHTGVLQFVTERALAVTDLAIACEERGLESLWVPEHPVVPVDYQTPYPLSPDGKLPRPYTELPDPFPLLAAAAAVTTRLRLGTGICLVPERDALMTALQVATLAMLPDRGLLADYRDAGADRVVVSIPTLPRDGTLAHLDRLASVLP